MLLRNITLPENSSSPSSRHRPHTVFTLQQLAWRGLTAPPPPTHRVASRAAPTTSSHTDGGALYPLVSLLPGGLLMLQGEASRVSRGLGSQTKTPPSAASRPRLQARAWGITLFGRAGRGPRCQGSGCAGSPTGLGGPSPGPGRAGCCLHPGSRRGPAHLLLNLCAPFPASAAPAALVQVLGVAGVGERVGTPVSARGALHLIKPLLLAPKPLLLLAGSPACLMGLHPHHTLTGPSPSVQPVSLDYLLTPIYLQSTTNFRRAGAIGAFAGYYNPII